MKRMSQYVPAMGVLALCLFNPWGFAALPDVGLILIGLLATTALVIAVRGGSLVVDKTMVSLGVAITTALFVSLLSIAPFLSIFGGLTRSSGVMSMAVWFIALLAGLQFNGDVTQRERQLLALGRASAFFALLVVLGRLGIAVVPFPESTRATGPLGSSAFSGAVLSFAMPIGIVRLFCHEIRLRYEAIFSLMLTTAALAATGARASWLGAVVGGLFALVIMLRKNDVDNVSLVGLRQIVLGLVAVLVIGTSAIFAFDTSSRVTAVAENDGTAAGRFVLWETGLRAIAQDPLIGVGFDQQESALAEKLPSDFEQRFGDSVIPDRAHNWLIDMWLGGGIFTVLAMAIAIVIALRRCDRDPLGQAIQFGVIGYLVQAQFNFSLPGVEAAVWLLLGVAISPNSRRVKLAIQPVIPTAILGALLTVPFVLNVVADTQLERGRVSELDGDIAQAQNLYESASSLASWQPAFEEVISRFGIRNGDGVLARASAAEAASRSGNQLRWRELQGEALLASGEFADARDWFQSLIDESPFDSSLFVGLGQAQMGLADTGGALVAFNTALQINPDSELAQAGLEQVTDNK